MARDNPGWGYLRIQGASDPEDLANEVFLGVFQRIGDFAGEEDRFRSWVFTIAHSRLIDDRRRTSRAQRGAGPGAMPPACARQCCRAADGAMRHHGSARISTVRAKSAARSSSSWSPGDGN